MLKFGRIFLCLILLDLTFSCGTNKGNFNKQKYTKLRHLKSDNEQSDSGHDNPITTDADGTQEQVDYSYSVSEDFPFQANDDVDVQIEEQTETDFFEEESGPSVELTNPPIVIKNERRDDRKNDRPQWQKTRNLGWWMFGLSLFLVGAGLGLAIVLWTEVIAYIFWPLAAIALAFAFIFFARSVKQKHNGDTKHKNLKIWSLVLFISSFGLGFLGFMFAAGLAVVDLIMFSTIILAVAAFVMSILMFIWSYNGLQNKTSTN